MQNIKLVVIGDSTVGKSCLLITSQTGLFPSEYVPTITDGCSKEILIDKRAYNVGFWDTAGQEEYNMLRQLSYPATDAFLVCFDVSNRNSFENIEHKWIPEIRHYCPDTANILVATKIDLRSNTAKNNRSPQDYVTYEEGKQLADKLGISTYLECSALSYVGIDAVIPTAVGAAVRKKASDEKSHSVVGKSDSTLSEACPPVSPPAEKKRTKLMVVGDDTVGKTCLLITVQTGSFPSEHVPIVADDYLQVILVDGHVHNVCLWDTGGGEDYDRLRPLSYPETDAFLVCFDVSNRTSFENIEQKWIPEIRHSLPESANILVATKIDLRSNTAKENRSPQDYVTYEEGRQLADKLGISIYLECSALSHEGIDAVIPTAVRTAVPDHENVHDNESRNEFCLLTRQIKKSR